MLSAHMRAHINTHPQDTLTDTWACTLTHILSQQVLQWNVYMVALGFFQAPAELSG